MTQRLVTRAAIAGFAVGVMGLAALAVTDGSGSGGSSPHRLPPLSLSGSGTAETAAALYPAVDIEYRLRGSLPELAARARVYTLGRDGTTSRVETLARAFGLDGPVQATADGWTVGAGGRVLRVERQSGLPWYFSPYTEDVVACTVPAAGPGAPASAPDTPVSSDACVSQGSVGSAGAGAGTTATTNASRPSTPPPSRPPGLPTREQAEATARQTLARAGIDLDGATARVDDGFSQWSVAFEPEIGGLAIVGFTTRVSVGPKGVTEASGWLAMPEAGDEYPLVSARAGFERLKDAPYGVGPQPLTAQAERAAPAIACNPTPSCPAPAPIVRMVTGVHLGLAFASMPDASGADADGLLVPVFLFDIEGGSAVPVLAVTDEYLPKPAPSPKPGVTGPAPAPEPGATEPAVEPAVP
jgi:hypothetical protein